MKEITLLFFFQQCSANGCYWWGDAVTTTAFSGSGLKSVALGLCSGHNANAPRVVLTEEKSAALLDGADSTTLSADAHHSEIVNHESLSIPRSVNTSRFSADRHDGASTEATGDFTTGDGCLGHDGAIAL